MVFGPLLTILIVGLLIALAVPFFRSIGGGSSEQQGSRARGILDERYAKGEIDREEYLRRRDDIAGE